jgi:hypothetical protein
VREILNHRVTLSEILERDDFIVDCVSYHSLGCFPRGNDEVVHC